jgi:CRISPR-associated protein Cas2
MTNYIISYDISETNLRTTLAKLLLRSGCQRIQKSVFFAPNFSADEIKTLRTNIQTIINHSNPANSIFALPFSKQQALNMTWLGDNQHINQILHNFHFALL